MTQTDAIEYIAERAKSFDAVTREAYLKMYSNLFDFDMTVEKQTRTFSSYIVPTIGLVLLIGLVFFAFYNPYPSTYQSSVYWLVLSLAGAAFAAFIPGFFEIRQRGWLRAGGALAVFLFIYKFMPAITDRDLGPRNHKLQVFIARNDTSDLENIAVDFEPNSSSKICDFAKKAIDEYYGTTDQDSFTVYRKSDGKIYVRELCRDVRELEILAISHSLMPLFKDKRAAYTHFERFANRVQ